METVSAPSTVNHYSSYANDSKTSSENAGIKPKIHKNRWRLELCPNPNPMGSL